MVRFPHSVFGFGKPEAGQFHHNPRDEHQVLVDGFVQNDFKSPWRKVVTASRKAQRSFRRDGGRMDMAASCCTG